MLPEYTSIPQNTIKLTGYTPPLNTAGRKRDSEHHKTERIGRYLNKIYFGSVPQNNTELAENTPHLITTE
jgi:hypothetical protein